MIIKALLGEAAPAGNRPLLRYGDQGADLCWIASTALGQADIRTVGLLIAGLLLFHLGARRGRRTAKYKADARDLRRSSDLRSRVGRERLRRLAEPPDIRYRD